MKRLIISLLLIISVSAAQDFNTGSFYLQLTNAGSTLIGSPNQQNLQIVRISPLISGSEGEVFDYLNDADSDTTAFTLPTPRFGNFHVATIFDNSFSFAPPAYEVELNSYGWTNGSYAISHYNVTNIDSFTYNSKFGLEILPFVDNLYGNETIVYDSENDYIKIYKDSLSTYIGVKFLNNPLISMNVIEWDTAYNRSDSLLYANLFSNEILPEYTAGELGSIIFQGIDLQSINPGETYDVYIALAVGIDEIQLDSNMTLAVERFNSDITSVVDNKALPKQIVLEQNYPNPFNPSTVIQFSLPYTQRVELTVYNLLGQKVESLINEQLSPGLHKIEFNGNRLSSGVYFYRLITDNFVQTRKMILVK
jgi:hypothetical protein